jgi:hypothetical protein
MSLGAGAAAVFTAVWIIFTQAMTRIARMVAVANTIKTYPRKHFGTRCCRAESKKRKGEKGCEQQSRVFHKKAPA